MMTDTLRYNSLINDGLRRISMNDAEVPRLYAPVRYALDCGGKRLRPMLVLMACEAVGGCADDALNAALGIEMFHNFTLLHDDVMDRSQMRRGRPTVHEKWDTNTAILSGDTMLTLATELVMDVPETVMSNVLHTFNRGALDVYEGQAYDMEFETRTETVSMDEYIKMISLKTGALLGTSCKIGALTGGASDQVAAAFYEYGMQLGIAFQIHDDFLDMYGDVNAFGKAIGGDVNNNKQTYLLVTASNMGGEISESLSVAMSMPRGAAKVEAVKRIYDSIGMAEMCLTATEAYCDAAIAAISAAALSDDTTNVFAELAPMLTYSDK